MNLEISGLSAKAVILLACPRDGRCEMKATDILKKQHREVKSLFKKVDKTEDPRGRQQLLAQITQALELHTLNLNAELRRSEAQLRCILVRGDNLSLLRPASASIHRRRGLGIRRSATCVILWPLSKMLLRLTRGGTHGHNTHTRHHCPRGRPPAEARESAGRPQRCLGHADQWIRGPTKVPTVDNTIILLKQQRSSHAGKALDQRATD